MRVVAAVIISGSNVLSCRRAQDKDLGGRWEFPGGKIDPFESPEDALARELWEELRVRVSVHEKIRQDVTRVGRLEIDLYCYRVTLSGPSPTSSTDHDLLRWIPITELRSVDWAEPDLPMVEELLKNH